MPIYEYVCKTCGERFELQQKFSDPPVTSCAQFSCEKNQPVEKVISAPAIMFKGTGWYVTDYSDKLKEPKKTETSDGKPASSEKGEQPKADSGSATQASSSAQAGNGSASSSSPSVSASSSSSSQSAASPASSS